MKYCLEMYQDNVTTIKIFVHHILSSLFFKHKLFYKNKYSKEKQENSCTPFISLS